LLLLRKIGDSVICIVFYVCVLNDSLSDINILHVSVAKRLWCDWIFTDQFIANKFTAEWKSVKNCVI